MKRVEQIKNHDLARLCAPLAEVLAGSADRIELARALNRIIIGQIREIENCATIFLNGKEVEHMLSSVNDKV
jgi:hypothetical protein